MKATFPCGLALWLGMFFASLSPTAAASDPGLIGHWNFEEGAGNIVHDATPNANHGTANGAFSWTAGVVGNGIELSGGSIDFPVPSNLSPATAITLEAWYKPVSFHGTGNDPIFDRGFTSHTLPAYQFHLGVCGDQYTPHPLPFSRAQFLFWIAVGSSQSDIRTPVDFWQPGEWYHIVGTYDGAMQKLYVNGVLITQKPLTGMIPDFANTMHFGGFSNLPYKLPGTLDELRIYERALTESEILAHYHLVYPQFVPLIVRIEKTHDSFSGSYEEVSIQKMLGAEQIGGFDFLLAYDPTGLSFVNAQLGDDLGPAGCGWEYFTYRHGAQGNCGGPCPSGLLRVVALADANNGANHPDCFLVPDEGELVRLRFFVTNNRLFECQYLPIRFVWIDCGDNAISNTGGDTLFISDKVFEFQNSNPNLDPSYEITDLDCAMTPHYGGACAECDTSLKYEPLRAIYFWNGGVDVVCADSIDARGDVNLNGIANEIADAVLYTNYFLFGLSALDPNATYREAQIAASDINADGVPLSVGDLVYLLRIIVGDALAFPKLAPFANDVTVSYDGTLTTTAAVDVGALVATFRATGECRISELAAMSVLSHSSDGVLRVLVYSGLENPQRRIAAGVNELFSVIGDAELVAVEAADYDGNLLNVTLNKAVRPQAFELLQNVPNPFNPSTRIAVRLPAASDWRIDIFNIAGQVVESFAGRGDEAINVEWNAAGQSSGVYFYRVTAGEFAATKKMLLLK